MDTRTGRITVSSRLGGVVEEDAGSVVWGLGFDGYPPPTYRNTVHHRFVHMAHSIRRNRLHAEGVSLRSGGPIAACFHDYSNTRCDGAVARSQRNWVRRYDLVVVHRSLDSEHLRRCYFDCVGGMADVWDDEEAVHRMAGLWRCQIDGETDFRRLAVLRIDMKAGGNGGIR